MSYGTRGWFLNKLITQGIKNPAAYFSHSTSGYHKYRYKRLYSYLQIVSDANLTGKMLDIGCSTGDFINIVLSKNKFEEAIGIDFMDEAIEMAKNKFPSIKFQVGCLPSLSFADETFNLVIASEVLYYLSNRDRQKALYEIFRVLKKDGLFMFSSVLGTNYFTSEGAKQFVGSLFEIDRVWYDYNKTYHLAMTPVNIINKINFHINAGSVPTEPNHTIYYDKYKGILNNPVFRHAIKIFSIFTIPLLRSEIIPSFLGFISRIINSEKTKTNITIISRKKIGSFNYSEIEK